MFFLLFLQPDASGARSAATIVSDQFAFPAAQEVWVPLQLDPIALKRGEGQFVTVFGRLKPGVTLEQARSEMKTIGKGNAPTSESAIAAGRKSGEATGASGTKWIPCW